MATSEAVVRAKKFDGNPAGYVDWKIQLNWVTIKSESAEILESDYENKDAAKHRTLNRRLFSDILMTCDSALASQIHDFDHGKNDGLGALKFLRERFEGKNQTRIHQLQSQLDELKC